MFYSSQLLSRKTPLGICWLASHLESKRLKRAQVFEVSITQSCDSIINPEAPLALRLSGQLLLGVVRIYQRKLTFLETDAKNAIDGLQRKEGASQNVDLPDGGTAPETTITLPDNDMGVFGGSDLFPSFNIAEGSPAGLSPGTHGLAGRLSLAGAESLTLADDISDVFGSTRWTASEERFDIVGADDIDRRFSAELERLRSQAAVENPRDTDMFYDGGGGDDSYGHVDQIMEPPPEDLFAMPEINGGKTPGSIGGVPLPGTADIRITPPSLGYADLPDIGGTGPTTAGYGGVELHHDGLQHQKRKKKIILDIGHDGLPATQLSNEEIRKLLNDRAPLLKKRGYIGDMIGNVPAGGGVGGERVPFAKRSDTNTNTANYNNNNTVYGPISSFDVRNQSEAARENYMYHPACYNKMAPELLATFNHAMGIAADGKLPGPGRNKRGAAGGDPDAAADDASPGGDAAVNLQNDGASPAPSWAFDDLGGVMDTAGVDGGYDYGGINNDDDDGDDGIGGGIMYDHENDYDEIETSQMDGGGLFGMGRASVGGSIPALGVVSASRRDDGGDADGRSGSRNGSGGSNRDGFTARTRVVLEHLQNRFAPAPGSKRKHPSSASPPDARVDALSLDSMVVGKSRLEACRWFFEALVLRNKGFVDLEQSEAYGEITIKPLQRLVA